MQNLKPTLLIKQNINKSLSQNKPLIVPQKREAEEYLESQFVMKARYSETLSKFELVRKWCKKPQQPSQISKKQVQIVHPKKQEQDSIVQGDAQNPQQISKAEQSDEPVQQKLKKQMQSSHQEKLESSEHQVYSQKKCLEHLQKQNLGNESQVEKVQNSDDKNRQNQQQKASQNQESIEDSKGRKSQKSISGLSSTKTDPLNNVYQKKKTKPSNIHCKFFPHCEKKDCEFKHPKIQCKFFPNCKQGIACMYTHKDCRYWDKCTKPSCIYNHPPRNLLQKYKMCPSVAQAFIKKVAKNLMTANTKPRDSKSKK